MVANGMHRNVGKSDSILKTESVGVFCKRRDVRETHTQA